MSVNGSITISPTSQQPADTDISALDIISLETEGRYTFTPKRLRGREWGTCIPSSVSRKTLPPSVTPGKTNVEAGLSPQIFQNAKIEKYL